MMMLLMMLLMMMMMMMIRKIMYNLMIQRYICTCTDHNLYITKLLLPRAESDLRLRYRYEYDDFFAAMELVKLSR